MKKTTDDEMDTEEFTEKMNILKKDGLLRGSWYPELTTKEKESIPHSHYGGLPLLSKDEAYPECKICNSLMALKIQFVIHLMPTLAQEFIVGNGVFQMFHCKEEDCMQLWYQDEGDGAHLARILPIENNEVVQMKALHEDEKLIPLKTQYIKEWRGQLDGDFIEDLQKEVSSDHPFLFDPAFEDIYNEYAPIFLDKVGGPPAWDPEEKHHRPRCPQCHKSKNHMRFILQINGTRELEYGDGGSAYIFQCEKHPSTIKMVRQGC
jgi:uncharacterized protein YwqG